MKRSADVCKLKAWQSVTRDDAFKFGCSKEIRDMHAKLKPEQELVQACYAAMDHILARAPEARKTLPESDHIWDRAMCAKTVVAILYAAVDRALANGIE